MINVKAKKFFDIVVIALFVTVAVALVSLTVQKASGKTPDFFGYSLLFVETDSMEDAIPKQSLILVKSRDFQKQPPKNGEIVVYYSSEYGVLNTHRVIDDSVKQGFVITKGDNTAGDDGLIAISDIKYYHVANLTALNGIARLFRSPIGFVCFVLLPCLATLAVLIFNIAKQSAVLKSEKNRSQNNQKIIDEIKAKAVEEYVEKNEKKQ